MQIDSKTGERLKVIKLPTNGTLSLDEAGNAIFRGGGGPESGYPVVNAIQSTSHISDAYVWKMDADGNIIFATYIGGGPDVIVSPGKIDFVELVRGERQRAFVKIENRGSQPIQLTRARGDNPNRFDGAWMDNPLTIAPGSEGQWEVVLKSLPDSDDPGERIRGESVQFTIPGYRGNLVPFWRGNVFVVEADAQIVAPPGSGASPIFTGQQTSGSSDTVDAIGAFGDVVYLLGRSRSDHGFPVPKPERDTDFALTLSPAGALQGSKFFPSNAVGQQHINETGLAVGIVSTKESFTASGIALFSEQGSNQQGLVVTSLADGSVPYATHLPDTWSKRERKAR